MAIPLKQLVSSELSGIIIALMQNVFKIYFRVTLALTVILCIIMSGNVRIGEAACGNVPGELSHLPIE